MEEIKDLLQDLLRLVSVQGVWLYSPEEDVFCFDSGTYEGLTEKGEFRAAIRAIPEQVKEAELIFENARIICRETPLGKIVVLMDPETSGAMVRLKLELVIENLDKRIRAAEKPENAGMRFTRWISGICSLKPG